jgi:CDP-glucose 4,6-dehydratase
VKAPKAMSPTFWNNRKVLITGHTGFKGSWLSLWLQHLGAKVTGISLDPLTKPSLYQQAEVAKDMNSLRQDIRNGEGLKQLFQKHQPEIVFHLAAQPLVRYSYKNPVETYETNVMGTLHILEAIRTIDSVQATVLITTDKCYQNREWYWGYREIDPMGGHDPYSSSKGAVELLIASYRDSFLPNIASVRAGNVIGGGDWAQDRLIPDIIRAFQNNETVKIRNPRAIRPWQHVLDPLAGYMQLAEKMTIKLKHYAQAWNFGPKDEDAKPVEWIVKQMAEQLNQENRQANWKIDSSDHPHEANYLKLDCSKAHTELNWYPKWGLQTTIRKIIEWHISETEKKNLREVTISQIKEYMENKNV